MTLSQNFKTAISSIKSSRFRSFLTMLGVIVSVASVVTIASLGEGIKRDVAGQASSVGSDLITIRPGNLVNRDNSGQITGINLLALLAAQSLQEKDWHSVEALLEVEKAVPSSILTATPKYGQNDYKSGFVVATTNHITDVTNQEIEFGSYFDNNDEGRKVAVVGHNVAVNLFNENVPLAKSFQVRGQEFIVKGVLERTPVNPLNPEIDYNNAVYIPFETAKTLINGELPVHEILVRPKQKDQPGTEAAISRINHTLKESRGGQEDFTVLKQSELVSVTERLFSTITTAVAVMAGVALLVGGVGIMNVMLVSVTERTREIGIRKAVGATNKQILGQFLTEAMVISFVGAFIGVLVSGLINISLILATNLKPVITWEMTLYAVGVSVLIGLVFGLIPAIKAAQKDPIEALRSF